MNNLIRRKWQQAEPVYIEDLRGTVFEAETGAHTFEISGVDMTGSQVMLSGTVSGTFMRPDNTDVAITGSISGGVAVLTLPERCYQVPGRFGLTIFLTSGSSKTCIYAAVGSVARSSTGSVSPDVAISVETLIARIDAAVASIPQDYSALSKSVTAQCPTLRDGSTGNASNANAITTRYLIKINDVYDRIVVEYLGSANATYFEFGYCLYKGVSDGMDTITAWTSASARRDRPNLFRTKKKMAVFSASDFGYGDYTHIAFILWAYASDGSTHVPLRIATEQNNLRVTFCNTEVVGHQEIDNKEVRINVLNAAKPTSPLVLAHFSDIHGDFYAQNRIVKTAETVCTKLDDIICTGDLVMNSAGEISNWWNPRVLTCIGNHDSASYSGGTYDWTALSMAERESYYISPFISNWGAVSHPSGTSYYYKDYADQHVRLIVLDVMLYKNAGAEAAAQTTWLANALATAITGGYHVLIGVHGPHGGAIPIPCSFTKKGETTAPAYSDCNTPQTVIDTVANAINSGLHFIGYICGHTHQDAIWDAEGDGTQLMYCITCGVVAQKANWATSDQNRSEEQDALNIIVVDTTKTLVKILRAGGANTSEYLQERDMIVIDYSTGKIVSSDTEIIPQISIGTVTTVASDQNANVIIHPGSTAENPVLDFYIPRGPAGTISNATGESINVSSSDPTTIASSLNALQTRINTMETVTIPSVAEEAQAERAIIVSGTISSLPATLSNVDVTADHIVVNAILGDIGAQGSDWTFTTSEDTVTVSGTLNKSTSLTLYLVKRKA